MQTVKHEQFSKWFSDFNSSGVGFLGEDATYDVDGNETSKKWRDWDGTVRAERANDGTYHVDTSWNYSE